jgi:hypothetical protein
MQTVSIHTAVAAAVSEVDDVPPSGTKSEVGFLLGRDLPHCTLTSFPPNWTPSDPVLAPSSALDRLTKFTNAHLVVGTITTDFMGVGEKKERISSSETDSGREDKKRDVCHQPCQLEVSVKNKNLECER